MLEFMSDVLDQDFLLPDKLSLLNIKLLYENFLGMDPLSEQLVV
jgi:hypothetical protein